MQMGVTWRRMWWQSRVNTARHLLRLLPNRSFRLICTIAIAFAAAEIALEQPYCGRGLNGRKGVYRSRNAPIQLRSVSDEVAFHTFAITPRTAYTFV